MSTPHNAANPGDIAKVVLMPGDPLRAKFVADNYLTDVTCFTQVRNMYGFTGTYEGKRISVMGSGMGVPSMAIYSYELFHFYGVDAIIRIGTAGGLATNVELRDVLIAQGVCTDSNFAAQYKLPGTIAPLGDYTMMRQAVDAAEALGVRYHVGNLLTTDVFYSDKSSSEAWAAMGVLGAEMELVGLYLNAAAAGKRAIGITTVSDLILRAGYLSAEERQTTFTQMMEIALAVAAQNAD